MKITKISFLIAIVLNHLLNADAPWVKYTITIKNSSTKYQINPGEIKFSTQGSCANISNDITLIPNSKPYVNNLSGECAATCFQKFSILNTEFKIGKVGDDKTCSDHTVEIKDDGIYYTGKNVSKKVKDTLGLGLRIYKFPGFNQEAYLRYNPEVKSKPYYSDKPVNHFVDIGSKKGAIVQIDVPNMDPKVGRFVGVNKYLQNNYDLVKKLSVQYSDPITKFQKVFADYINSSAQEGREIFLPLAGFNVQKYLEFNPDIKNDNYYKNKPMQHFIDIGYKEGRKIQVDIPGQQSEIGRFVGIDKYLKYFPTNKPLGVHIDTKQDPITIQLIKIFEHYQNIGKDYYEKDYSIIEPKSDECKRGGGEWQWLEKTCICPKGSEWSKTKTQCCLPDLSCINPNDIANCKTHGGVWEGPTCNCTGGRVWSSSYCICPYVGLEQQAWDGSQCVSVKEAGCKFSNGTWDGNNCKCPEGTDWYRTKCIKV